MQVGQILKGRPNRIISIRPDETIAEAARMLERERVGAILVVTAGGSLEGIISERDMARAIARHGERLPGMRVAELMTKAVVTIGPEVDVDEVMHIMTERRFRHLPVTEGGAIAGVISIGDVVKFRLEELQAESSMLRDYVAGY